MLMPGASAEEREFEDIIDELSEECNIPVKNLIVGYMNLVTGEEHYWQGDKWEYGASMYKVPLSMYVAEKKLSGKLNWEKKYPKIPYKYVLEETLLYSSNRWAKFLWEACGSYTDYKRGAMPYLGLEKSDLYAGYYCDNKFTARQMISCLKTLYDEPDRFPDILDLMKEADPERFFRFSEKRYDIAQKYGFVKENGSYYVNTCGIVFTDEPIAIVIFTKNAPHSDATISAYCTAMCNYTENKIKASEDR